MKYENLKDRLFYKNFRDIFMIDFKEFQGNGILQWNEIKFSGNFPSRWGHSVVGYKKDLYIFGYILYLLINI